MELSKAETETMLLPYTWGSQGVLARASIAYLNQVNQKIEGFGLDQDPLAVGTVHALKRRTSDR